MPTWSGILQEIIAARTVHGPAAFDHIRKKYLAELAAHTGRQTILYASQWTQAGAGVSPYLISITLEDVQGLMEVVHGLPNQAPLDLIVHSPGGSPEATEALVAYLRSKFSHIRVIVPHAAMSAATMLACASDEIMMGKHSFLGPIDPQLIISGPLGTRSEPAQAIIDQFARAQEECKDPQLLGAWVPMLGQYGPSLLVQCENALMMAENLVAEWLRTWMLSGQPNGARRARSIARRLKNHKEFKSHSRHISRDRARGMGLVVHDLEQDQVMQDLVLSVFHATTLAFEASPVVKIIQNHQGRLFAKYTLGAQAAAQPPAAQQPQKPAAPPRASAPPPTDGAQAPASAS